MSAMRRFLIQRAIINFPRLDYLNEEAVRHNRRAWLDSVAYLRARGLWILDAPITRKESA